MQGAAHSKGCGLARRKDTASSTEKGACEFETSLAQYLAALRLPPAQATYVRALCEAHDFSSARAHLVPSVPGWHAGKLN